ncbi:hypothetical protein PR048_007474 [Dryococelus australis]|uniref:C2H2-type domain-containing protein n=1 Tax=Dryococelus australis TaxID=614101 RepID=A0ABQ9HUD9_9NEOP|nr:hypothetical protein PR048_007474 [Dryococelus australis]
MYVCWIHRDERPYHCEVCKAAFRRSFALKNHMTLHTGVRAYVCEVCGKDFRMHQELTKHLRVCHSDRDGDEPEEQQDDDDPAECTLAKD